jgi:hypothetical protein
MCIPYATPDLLLKYPHTTLATYKKGQIKHLKHAYETLAKTIENHCKHLDKTFATYV